MIEQGFLVMDDRDIELLLTAIDVTILFMKDNEGELEEKQMAVRKLINELKALAQKLERGV